MKKSLSVCLVIVFVLALSVLPGCGKKKTENKSSKPSPSVPRY